MSDRAFLDTNILVYTFDDSAPDKRETARGLVRRALEDGGAIISWQVVQEFLSLASRKFARVLCAADRARYLQGVLAPLCEVFPTVELYGVALDVQERWQLSFYDASILAAALVADCGTVFTEDLHHGLVVRGLSVVDPFR